MLWDEENVELHSAFFNSVFYSQTNYPQSTQPPELEVSDWEQNKPLTFQE